MGRQVFMLPVVLDRLRIVGIRKVHHLVFRDYQQEYIRLLSIQSHLPIVQQWRLR